MLVFSKIVSTLLAVLMLNVSPVFQDFLSFFEPLLIIPMMEIGGVEEFIPTETTPAEEESETEEIPAAELTEERAWELLDRTYMALSRLKYYFNDRGLLDESVTYPYYSAVAPDVERTCVSILGVEDVYDLSMLLQDDFTYRYVQEHFMNGLRWDELNQVYIMEGHWFESYYQGGIYVMDYWEAGPDFLAEDTVQIAQTGDDTYKISAESEFDTLRFYCNVVCEDGVYKVSDSHIGTGEPDFATAKSLLLRAENGARWLVYHFAMDELTNWEDTLTVDVLDGYEGGSQMEDAYTVDGIDTWEDLEQALSIHFTDDAISYYRQESYTLGNRTVYNGEWFEENGTIYFLPNWGMGTLMTDYETVQVQALGENRWEITAQAEYETTSSCVVIYDEEAGAYLIDR